MESLAGLLPSNKDDIAWNYCNCAVMAVEYIFLLRNSMSTEITLENLSPLEKLIQASIGREVNWQKFIEKSHSLLISTEDLN